MVAQPASFLLLHEVDNKHPFCNRRSHESDVGAKFALFNERSNDDSDNDDLCTAGEDL